MNERKYKYWFEDDDEDFWRDELDLRFVIPGLIGMVFSIPLIIFVPYTWFRVCVLLLFLASFVAVAKRKGRWW